MCIDEVLKLLIKWHGKLFSVWFFYIMKDHREDLPNRSKEHIRKDLGFLLLTLERIAHDRDRSKNVSKRVVQGSE